MNDKERSLICSLATEIRAGGFSDEITINIAGGQVLAVFEIVPKDRPYISDWQTLWAQATPGEIDSLTKANFLLLQPKGDSRYWLDTKRILAECE